MKRAFSTLVAAALLVVLLGPGRAESGDVTAFVTLPAPTDTWGRGYGAALASTWFTALRFEGEAARLPGDSTDTSMTSFTGAALLAPPVGIVTPYGGVGVGVFRQSLGADTDVGTLRALILGAKLKLGPLVVVRGEYRRLTLSGTPLLPMTARITAGAGISF